MASCASFEAHAAQKKIIPLADEQLPIELSNPNADHGQLSQVEDSTVMEARGPHSILKQAKAFASTLMKGDPRERKVIKETAKELVADLLPTRS